MSNCVLAVLADIRPKCTLMVIQYKAKNEAGYPEYFILAFDSENNSVGMLGYIDFLAFIKIGIILIKDSYRGQGYSDCLIEKLLRLSKGRPVLTGQVNYFSARMLQRMQKEGLINILEPRSGYETITMWEIRLRN
jgi:predicted GNAT family acetyltransferase